MPNYAFGRSTLNRKPEGKTRASSIQSVAPARTALVEEWAGVRLDCDRLNRRCSKADLFRKE